MSCGRSGHRAVFIDGIGTFRGHLGDHAETGIIADHRALAGFDCVAVGEQGIGTVRVQRQGKIECQTGVIVHQTGEIAALELEVLDFVHIAFRTGQFDRICAGHCGRIRCGTAVLSGRSSGSTWRRFGGEDTAQNKGRNQDRYENQGAHAAKRPFRGRFAGFVIRSVFAERADDVEYHCRKPCDRAAERHIDRFLTAVTGVVVGQDTIADAFHSVTDQRHCGECKQGCHTERKKLWPPCIGEFIQAENGGAFENDRSDRADRDHNGVHLPIDVITCREVEGEQNNAENRQYDDDCTGNGFTSEVLLHGLRPPFLSFC